MFEEEAEERITEQFGTSGEYVTRQRIWQDGAEFGYNKGKREAKEIIRSLLYHLSNDTFAVIYETKEESIEKAEQFIK